MSSDALWAKFADSSGLYSESNMLLRQYVDARISEMTGRSADAGTGDDETAALRAIRRGDKAGAAAIRNKYERSKLRPAEGTVGARKR